MPAVFVTSADAVDREAAWLAMPGTANDALPSLRTDDGGPWDVVQAYQRRTPAQRKTQLYVTRAEIVIDRWANVRTIFSYEFVLKLIWPLSSGTGSAEADQRAFDAAVHMVAMRIRGIGPNRPGGSDKTHNGAFMQVAEGSQVTRTSPGIHIHFDDAEQTMVSGLDFRATVTYAADDRDFND